MSLLVWLTHQICSGDHCELVLLYLLERALWSLRDPQHLHCNPFLVMSASNDHLMHLPHVPCKVLLKQGVGWDPPRDSTSCALWVCQWLRLHRWSMCRFNFIDWFWRPRWCMWQLPCWWPILLPALELLLSGTKNSHFFDNIKSWTHQVLALV